MTTPEPLTARQVIDDLDAPLAEMTVAEKVADMGARLNIAEALKSHRRLMYREVSREGINAVYYQKIDQFDPLPKRRRDSFCDRCEETWPCAAFVMLKRLELIEARSAALERERNALSDRYCDALLELIRQGVSVGVDNNGLPFVDELRRTLASQPEADEPDGD